MYSVQVEKINLEDHFGDFPDLGENYFYFNEMVAYEEEYSGQTLNGQILTCQKNKQIIGVMPFSLSDNKEISFFNKPLKVFWKRGIEADDKYESYQLIFQEFEMKFQKEELLKIICSDDAYFLSEWQKFSLKPFYEYESFIDLNLSEEAIKRGIRKSYRSLINWGLREMSFVRIDQENIDENLFHQFRQFHIKVAGKETRTKKSWEHQLQFIKEGKGFLELGYFQGNMVSGILVLSGQSEAYYAVAVNDRELMAEKKPIGHAVIYRAIMRAKELKMKVFNLGHVGPEFSNAKEFEIGKFKKGLSAQCRVKNYFHVSSTQEQV